MPKTNASTIFLHDADVRVIYERTRHIQEDGGQMFLTELIAVKVQMFDQDIDILPCLTDEVKRCIVTEITRKEPELLEALQNIIY